MNYDTRTKHFIKEVRILSQIVDLRLTKTALTLLLETMTRENGCSRHDGSHYYVHPIAVAQTALDFQLVANRIRDGKTREADLLLAGCLLHDYLEDVDSNKAAFIGLFDDGLGQHLYEIVANVSKIEGEEHGQYVKRVSSHPISALIKVLDRLNNFSTLSQSSREHRSAQLKETTEVYLPLIEDFRKQYWQDGDFYWQAKTIIEALARELTRYFEDIAFLKSN